MDITQNNPFSNLAPFTKKQVDYINRCAVNWLNVLEGGKRGTKNVVNTLSFCIALETHKNRLHLVAGVSVAAAKLNIVDCDGFGILSYFKGRCREGKYKDRDCIYVKTLTGEKIILISGGGKKGDEKLIKGNTYGMALVTEANECHTLFIQEVFDRTLSSTDRKVFFDFNPKAPKHWFCNDILDFHESHQKKDKSYGFNYAHMTIVDNLSLSDNQIRGILKTYDKKSIWYKRDILGLRIAGEGSIYPLFANDPDAFLITQVPYLQLVAIGVDFGGNKSGQSFTCVGFTAGFGEVVVLDEEYRNGSIDDPASLAKAFSKFVQRNKAKYPTIKYVFADSAEQVLIRGLETQAKIDKLGVQINNALKTQITERIRLTNLLLSSKKLKIMAHCTVLQGALENAVWDEKQTDDVRKDDFTSNIDALDSFEYCIESFGDKINFYKAAE